MIAALFVDRKGPYWGRHNIDAWDEERDARLYQGPHRVIAHPPCQRWGKLWAGSPSYIARTGIRKKKGDDGGCFASALASVRKWGGVLEHPWGSHAWPHFGLEIPQRTGGWVKADEHGGFTCCVEQGQYGHYARKPTMLYAVGVKLPELVWGKTEPQFPQWAIDKYGLAKCKRIGEIGLRGGGVDSSIRNGTPEGFMNLLIGMVRG